MSDFPAKVDGIGEAERLERARHADMIWLGPGGIGATHNIPRYIKQHCEPFNYGLRTGCKSNGHLYRMANWRGKGYS